MSFGKNLKKLRSEHHLTQDELAKATGINRSNLAMYEKDNRRPQVEKLQILAQYFHVDMNTLLADGNSTAPLSPGEQRHMDQYLLLDADNRRTIDDQTEYLLYRQTAAETKKDPA